MKIELLYFDECPSYQNARVLLEQVLTEEGIAAPIVLIRVVDEADAVNKQFVGSPTLRVNGADLFPDQTSAVYAMQCRVYRTPLGLMRSFAKLRLGTNAACRRKRCCVRRCKPRNESKICNHSNH